MFHFKVTTNKWAKIGDIALTIFGLGMMIYTLYVNINSWVHPSSSGRAVPDPCPAT